MQIVLETDLETFSAPKFDIGAEPLERCAKQMVGVLLHKHCHISWQTVG